MTARRILPAFLGAEPGEELVQARLGAVLAAEPDGPAPLQVADHDAVAGAAWPMAISSMPMTRGAGQPGPAELLPHVLLVQLLDGVPVEVQFLGHRLDGALPAAPPDEEGEPLGVERVVGQPVQPFALHAATPAAADPADREVEVDPPVATGEVADAAGPLVVEGATGSCRRRRSAFFSAAAEGDDHRPGVAEDTPDLGHRDEAGEPVDVLESLEFAHPRIVTSFRRRRKGVAAQRNKANDESQGQETTHTIPRRASDTRSPSSANRP